MLTLIDCSSWASAEALPGFHVLPRRLSSDVAHVGCIDGSDCHLSLGRRTNSCSNSFVHCTMKGELDGPFMQSYIETLHPRVHERPRGMFPVGLGCENGGTWRADAKGVWCKMESSLDSGDRQ